MRMRATSMCRRGRGRGAGAARRAGAAYAPPSVFKGKAEERKAGARLGLCSLLGIGSTLVLALVPHAGRSCRRRRRRRRRCRGRNGRTLLLARALMRPPPRGVEADDVHDAGKGEGPWRSDLRWRRRAGAGRGDVGMRGRYPRAWGDAGAGARSWRRGAEVAHAPRDEADDSERPLALSPIDLPLALAPALALAVAPSLLACRCCCARGRARPLPPAKGADCEVAARAQRGAQSSRRPGGAQAGPFEEG